MRLFSKGRGVWNECESIASRALFRVVTGSDEWTEEVRAHCDRCYDDKTETSEVQAVFLLLIQSPVKYALEFNCRC